MCPAILSLKPWNVVAIILKTVSHAFSIPCYPHPRNSAYSLRIIPPAVPSRTLLFPSLSHTFPTLDQCPHPRNSSVPFHLQFWNSVSYCSQLWNGVPCCPELGTLELCCLHPRNSISCHPHPGILAILSLRTVCPAVPSSEPWNFVATS